MSTLNIGGQLIENTDYSIGEVKTGARWIDGKPIYKKVISGTPTASTSTNRIVYYYSEAVSNIRNLINAYGTIEYTYGGGSYVCMFGSSNFSAGGSVQYMTNIDFNRTTITVTLARHVDFAMTATKFNVTVEYTKTS